MAETVEINRGGGAAGVKEWCRCVIKGPPRRRLMKVRARGSKVLGGATHKLGRGADNKLWRGGGQQALTGGSKTS